MTGRTNILVLVEISKWRDDQDDHYWKTATTNFLITPVARFSVAMWVSCSFAVPAALYSQ
jgi:hypothetical protein